LQQAETSNVGKRERKRKKTNKPRLCLLRMNGTPWRSDDTNLQQSMSMAKCIRVYVLGGRMLRLTNGTEEFFDYVG
jgi:hypothetical protein